MKAIVFGGSGMIGSGVLLECFEDLTVESVLSVGRSPCGLTHPKLTELVHEDLFDLRARRAELTGLDSCFYCLGTTSTGLSEAVYRRLTVDLTRAILDVVVETSPDVTICFVSGQGTDDSEQGRVMWARVKGAAENYVRSLPVRSYLFRPGFIQPLKGVRSRTKLYQTLYDIIRPLTPMLVRLLPGGATTSVVLGRAMIRAGAGADVPQVLETRDINRLGA